MAFNSNKTQNFQGVSPVGAAKYAWLTKPDTKFNPEGDYKVNLVLDSKSATSLASIVDQAMADSYKSAQEQSKGKRIQKGRPPYRPVLDDSGDETGETEFVFKSKASFVTKDGKKIDRKIDLFDAKGKPLSGDDVAIFGGARIKVAYEIAPYYSAGLAGAGVTLRIRAVQILELAGGKKDKASIFGFTEEDGYEHDDSASRTATEEIDDDVDALGSDPVMAAGEDDGEDFEDF